MKTNDIILIGGLAIGGYFLYKYLTGGEGVLSGGASGGAGMVTDAFDTLGEDIGFTSAAAPVIRFDYSNVPQIIPSNIQKRINVLSNIGSKTMIPQLKIVTQKAIAVERKKQTVGVLQKIRSTTIIPQLERATGKILERMP